MVVVLSTFSLLKHKTIFYYNDKGVVSQRVMQLFFFGCRSSGEIRLIGLIRLISGFAGSLEMPRHAASLQAGEVNRVSALYRRHDRASGLLRSLKKSTKNVDISNIRCNFVVE